LAIDRLQVAETISKRYTPIIIHDYDQSTLHYFRDTAT